MILSGRPSPPELLCYEAETRPDFVAAPDLLEWAIETFVEESGALCNSDHAHLAGATIGFLWTNCPNGRGGRYVAGTAEMPGVMGGKWARGRFDQQLHGWFGQVPDFLITIFAPYAVEASDAAFCSLIEHEMYHCGQKLDRWGQPRYDLDGNPVFGIRPHDAEEFVGVVRRYGAGNAAAGVAQLVEAANRKPVVASADIAVACGTCRR